MTRMRPYWRTRRREQHDVLNWMIADNSYHLLPCQPLVYRGGRCSTQRGTTTEWRRYECSRAIVVKCRRVLRLLRVRFLVLSCHGICSKGAQFVRRVSVDKTKYLYTLLRIKDNNLSKISRRQLLLPCMRSSHDGEWGRLTLNKSPSHSNSRRCTSLLHTLHHKNIIHHAFPSKKRTCFVRR